MSTDRSPRYVLIALVGLSLRAALACSEGSDGTAIDRGNSTATLKACVLGANQSCSPEEVESHSACVVSNCDAEVRLCYGEDYRSGQFAGPCARSAECIQRCGCSDEACIADCGRDEDPACHDCQQRAVSLCVSRSGCSAPSCTRVEIGSSGSLIGYGDAGGG